MGIGQSDAAQSQDWDVGLASFLKCDEARWAGVGLSFFRRRGEDREGCVAGGGLGYFFWGVTGDCRSGDSW